MPIDPYALCPCGSGKKLKFCCSDLVGEIEKIHRMIEGDQPRAALRHVDQALAQHPRRASLLDLKAWLELSLGEKEAARKTVQEFVTAHPESATAHGCEAMLLAELRQPLDAVAALQRALSLVERDIPLRVHQAMSAVGTALLEGGHVLAAQAHLWLHAALASKEDTSSREVLAALYRYSDLPLLLRDQQNLRPWPDNAPWKEEAEQATRLANNAKWQQAVEIIDGLGQRYGAEPTLVFNRALLGAWLGDERALVAGFHAYAQLDVPLDDAVEAEAIAQLLDPELKASRLNSVVQVYSIVNLDELVARLEKDVRLQPFEFEKPFHGDEPRPRHSYVLLDRPMPTTGVDLTRDQIPRIVGLVSVFGRQTDRAERLELTVDKGPGYSPTLATLREIVGDALGEVIDEKVFDSVSPAQQALTWRWRFPPDTPQEVQRRLLAEERRSAILERWADTPLPELEGKSPREAAADPQLSVPLMAAILNVEQSGKTTLDHEHIAELRRVLGLEQPAAIDPADAPLSRLPLVRVPRLKTESLSDEELLKLYYRCLMVRAEIALLHLAQEIVRRPSLAERVPLTDAYRRLITAQEEPAKAMALIDQAREHTRSCGVSPATWDLMELALHITSGDFTEAKQTLTRIEREHRDDPDVAAALYSLLYEMGVVAEDIYPPDELEDEDSVPAIAGAEPVGSRIWTPDSDRPPGGKSALWTPS
jgi:hypothetical protein